MPKEYHVTILTDTREACPDRVELTAGEDVEIVWHADKPGRGFHVQFPGKGKPFEEQDFDQDHNHSKRPVVHPPHGQKQEFHYNVHVGATVIDPIVVIKG